MMTSLSSDVHPTANEPRTHQAITTYALRDRPSRIGPMPTGHDTQESIDGQEDILLPLGEGRKSEKCDRCGQPAVAIDTTRSRCHHHNRKQEHSFTDGGAFILDTPLAPTPVWGDGFEVLWQDGEPALASGPIGVGKTTLLGRLVHASMSGGEILGYPVQECERVLYLALDRPTQIARNLHRMFTDADRPMLKSRLRVWRGPLPGDISKQTDLLLDLADDAGLERGDRMFIDSVKDTAIGIASDEVGAAVNLAHQKVVSAGINLMGNHHQRKSGENGTKPCKINDLYGSTFIPAGCGTVILAWADQPGASIVEFSTLKPAAEHVGPLTAVHDIEAGTLTVENQVQPIDVVRASPYKAFSVSEVMTAMGYDKADRNLHARVARALDREVEDHRVQVSHHRRPTGGKATKFYQWDTEMPK